MDCQELTEMTDFSLLRDLIFVVFSVSNFLTSIGYNLPYIYIPVSITQYYSNFGLIPTYFFRIIRNQMVLFVALKNCQNDEHIDIRRFQERGLIRDLAFLSHIIF